MTDEHIADTEPVTKSVERVDHSRLQINPSVSWGQRIEEQKGAGEGQSDCDRKEMDIILVGNSIAKLLFISKNLLHLLPS